MVATPAIPPEATWAAEHRGRPTRASSNNGARLALEAFAQAVDGRLVLSPSQPKGKHSRVVRARIVGGNVTVPRRYRVVVTRVPGGTEWIGMTAR